MQDEVWAQDLAVDAHEQAVGVALDGVELRAEQHPYSGSLHAVRELGR